MIQFTYLCILLFIIIFILYLMNLNLRKCPIKIKRYYLIVLTIALFRYVSLVVLLLVNNQKIVYLIRCIIQGNYVYIPLIALGCLYIFLRNEKRSFDYNYIYLGIISALYCLLLWIYKLNINIDSAFGFIVNFRNYLMPSLIYLIYISSITVISLLFIDKPYSNSGGIKLLMVTSIVTIIEFIMFLGGIKIVPYPIIGEVFMFICSYKSINTFKEN